MYRVQGLSALGAVAGLEVGAALEPEDEVRVRVSLHERIGRWAKMGTRPLVAGGLAVGVATTLKSVRSQLPEVEIDGGLWRTRHCVWRTQQECDAWEARRLAHQQGGHLQVRHRNRSARTSRSSMSALPRTSEHCGYHN